jgi:benzoate/toluate 1,2-dioxygenase beta subunit
MDARELHHVVEQFLFHEAWLLDRGQYDQWLSLYTEDCRYWVPLEPGQLDGENTCSVIHDDRQLLEIRVRQTRHPRAHARVPASRTVHQVSNVRVMGTEADELVVASTLSVIEFRADRQRIHAALVEHRLHQTPDGLRIRQKRIDLVNAEGPHEAITILF